MIPPIVDERWLAAHREEVVLADVRWGRIGSAHRAHLTGHLPGAILVDLDRDLAAPAGPVVGRHPLPSPDEFADRMSALGIGDEDTVVAYDDAHGAFAARLVWMLRALGHDAALLDGGLEAVDAPLETADVQRPPARFTPGPWPVDRLADVDDVDRLRGQGDAVVIDARAPERFRGDEEPLDPRAGHIPGARNAPYADNLDDDGRFLPPDVLRQRYARLGVDEAEEVVVHCGSGVTACHDVLAIEHAGLGTARLYVGSWSGWSSDPERPVATGDD